MNNPIYRRDSCRLCGSRNLELVLKLAPTPIGADYVPSNRLNELQESYPMDLYLCQDCSYVGLIDVVHPELLFDESAEITSMSLGVSDDLQQLANKTVNRLNLAKDSLVVDIGSNDGTLLRAFQNLGMQVLGVEPSHFAANAAIASGVPTLTTYFTVETAKSIVQERGQAQAISANRVLANIDNMDDLIEGVRVLLDPNGMMVFETAYLLDIFDHDLLDTIYHEHLGYDRAKAFEAYFRDHSMELIDIERIPLKGGSLRGAVQHKGGPRPVSPSVSQLIELEESRGIGAAQIFMDFSKRIEVIKSELHELLFDLKNQGNTIAGYGASVGSTTLTYNFELGELLTLLLDDDPRNQNLFSPGYHIPVKSSEFLYEQPPDYVLILAWRYAEDIMKRHQKYLDDGGHFIVPLPELKVL